MNFFNLATGQTLNECDFYAHITGTDWSCCATDDEVWISGNKALTNTEWYAWFMNNTPSCPDVAPTCMPVIITGGDQPGDTLSVVSWAVSGIPTPVKDYMWQQSTDGGSTWTTIGTSTTLLITAPMAGTLIRCRGNATNSEGISTCFSSVVEIFPDYSAPVQVTGASISGGSSLGSIITCSPGSYSGFPNSFTFNYQWYSNGVQVGTNSDTYELKMYDSLADIKCYVTVSNGIAPNLVSISNTITADDYAPQLVASPVISGSTALNGILTCSTGTWSGSGIVYTYQWYVNGNQVGNDSNQIQLQLGWSLAFIHCAVTATNSAGTNTDSSNTLTAGDFSPVNTIAPVISVIGGGPANPGTTLQSTTGTWVGPNINYTYEWYFGATLLGTGSTFLVTNANSGQAIECVVTATNSGGITSAISNSITVPSGPGVTPPSNVTTPTISVASGGTPLAGKSLVCNVGAWLGTSPIYYTYQWYSASTPVGTGVSYTMQPSDIGNAITCVVTGTNAFGVATTTSNGITPTGSVNVAPSNVLAPTIYVANGTPALAGKALTVDIGAWDGTSPITFSYQWFSNSTPVGLDDPSYLMQSSDIGHNMTCQVTATNPYGTASATSNAIACIGTIYTAPSNITPPSISTCGDAIVGTCLSSNIGTWDGDDVTYSFEWYSGALLVSTSENYQLQSSDFGLSITLKVTATNPYGTAVAVTSAITCVDIPKNTIIPSISGTLVVGNVLTCATGTWTGTATITYAYQWFKNGGLISGETANTYTTVNGDEGQNITCRVIGSNTYGTSSASFTTAVLPTRAPVGLQLPIIYGSLGIGDTLTVQDGYYGGYPTPTVTRKWQYSTNSGTTWNDFTPPQTGSTYTIVSGDVGSIIRVVDTATNSVGTTTQNSNIVTPATTVVARPLNTVAPSISGTPKIAQTLSTTNGTWSNTPTSYSYQWYRGSTPIGTSANTYTLVSADVNSSITCIVTATNAGGSQPSPISNSIYAYDADFYAIVEYAVANSITAPSTTQQQWLSKMVADLKTNSMWTIFDRFWTFAQDGSSNFARLDWKNPSTTGNQVTLVNTPTWTSNKGYSGTGTAYIDTNFNPTTNGSQYTLNNAGRYLFISARSAGTAIFLDGTDTTNENAMIMHSSNNANNINSGTTLGSTLATLTVGFHSITRTSSTASSRSTSFNASNNHNSSALINKNQFIMRSGNSYNTNSTYGWYALGGAISDANIPVLREIINKYLYAL